MNIPKKFEFYVSPRRDTKYTANVDGDTVLVTWTTPYMGSTVYPLSQSRTYVQDGDWIITKDLTPKEVKLPDTFKAVNINTNIVVTLTRISEDSFKGEWEDGTHYSYEYNESYVKQLLGTGYITFLKDGKGLSLIEKIKQFTNKTSSDVIIDKKGFAVQYGDSDFVRVADEQELLNVMKIVEDFHKVFANKLFHGE